MRWEDRSRGEGERRLEERRVKRGEERREERKRGKGGEKIRRGEEERIISFETFN